MSIAQPKHQKSIYFYSLCNELLGSVASSPYLGVTLSDTLSPLQHSKAVAKASRMLGFISRTLRSAPPKLKELAYFSLCRSHLEYACQVWDPPENSQAANNIERIQRRAARFVVNDRRQRSSVTAILQRLQWEPLSSRRKNQRLVLLYQIRNNLVSVQLSDNLLSEGYRSRYRQFRTNTTVFRDSFLPRTIRDWNCLNQSIRDSDTTESFQERLPKALY